MHMSSSHMHASAKMLTATRQQEGGWPSAQIGPVMLKLPNSKPLFN